MVTKSILRFLLLTSLLIWQSIAYASVSVYPKKITLGEPVIMVFKGKNIESDFEKLDKSALKKQVEIFDIEGDSDRIRLMLYPRKSGKIKLPAMHFGLINYLGEVIQVNKNAEVSIRWQPPALEAFPNQYIIWQAKVAVTNSAHQITLEQHPHKNNQLNYLYQELAVDNSLVLKGKSEHFIFATISKNSGKITIRSPVIKVKNSGSRPWLFFDKTVTMNIKPLPSYLPISMPVGKVSLKLTERPFIISKSELITLSWTITGKNLPANLLPNIQDELVSQSGEIEWLSADIQRQQSLSPQGVISQLIVSQPFRINQIGFSQIPKIRLTYFDSSSQQLVDQFIPANWIIIVPSWLTWLLTLFSLLIGLVFLYVLFLILQQAWRKGKLIYQLKQAESLDDVWQACTKWSGNDLTKPNNLTIGLWQKKVSTYKKENKKETDQELAKLSDLLNQQTYAKNAELNLTKTKQVALKWANKLPWFYINDRELKRIYLKQFA